VFYRVVLITCTAQAGPFMVCCLDIGFMASTFMDLSFMCACYCPNIVRCRQRPGDRPIRRLKDHMKYLQGSHKSWKRDAFCAIGVCCSTDKI
jgi:hypothetical protein